MTRVALDSNILVYLARLARVPADEEKVGRVEALIVRLSEAVTLVAPVQALGECFTVLLRAGRTAKEAREIMVDFGSSFGTPASERAAALAAADLVVDHKLQFWDAMIVSAAVDAGCTLLLSEDMQHGFVTRGLTIVNPLADEPHPKLAALLQAG